MRHKYTTRALVLARTPLGEANGLVTILTEDLGILRARAQGIRKPGAKLAAALATYSESTVVLVRGQEGWRITGAVLEEPRFTTLATHEARERAARVIGLVVQLVAGEVAEARLFPLLIHFLRALVDSPRESGEAIECLAALSLLAVLGLDTGSDLPTAFDPAAITSVAAHRREYITRINQGLEASGL